MLFCEWSEFHTAFHQMHNTMHESDSLQTVLMEQNVYTFSVSEDESE